MVLLVNLLSTFLGFSMDHSVRVMAHIPSGNWCLVPVSAEASFGTDSEGCYLAPVAWIGATEVREVLPSQPQKSLKNEQFILRSNDQIWEIQGLLHS